MEPEQKSNGALIGSIIIVIILILGGIYFWQSSMKQKTVPNPETSPTLSETTESTDDTSSLEAEVNGVDLDSLDSGI